MLRRRPNGFEISGLLSLLIHFVHFVLWRILPVGLKCVQMQKILIWMVCLFLMQELVKKKSYMWSAFSGEFACCVAIRLQGRLHAQVTSGQLSDLSRFLLSRSSEHWWKTPEKPKVTKVCRNKARAPKTYNNGFLSSSSSHQTHLKNNKNGERER